MPEPMVVLRRNPNTRWWNWTCCSCLRWSTWPAWDDAMQHADRHARKHCPGEVIYQLEPTA